MRAYAPAIAQGEGRSLGEWRIGVFLCAPTPSIKSDKNIIMPYKVIASKICISAFSKAVFAAKLVNGMLKHHKTFNVTVNKIICNSFDL